MTLGTFIISGLTLVTQGNQEKKILVQLQAEHGNAQVNVSYEVGTKLTIGMEFSLKEGFAA